MVKMFKKSSLLSKIAMILSILSMIVAFSNVFVQSEKLRVIVWCLVVIVLSLDLWSTIKENYKLINHNFVLSEAYLKAIAAYGRIEIQIDCMDIPEEAKEQLKDYIESECEEIKAIREGLAKL